ncbi:MAG: hypothetical protein NZ893_02220 [Candidatus Aenigmarchaeota archaeon]|nr:hypothetical protein [Candidatus Aenigmarchaeota archaeon]
MFGLFKRKKESLELPPPEVVETAKSLTEEVVSKTVEPEETKSLQNVESVPELEKLDVEAELKDLESLMPKESLPSKNMTLENLCIKIDLEAEDIERRVKEFKTMVSKINLNSAEVFELLDLYSKAKAKLKDFVNEIDRFDAVGWGVDDETAAFYKFRACKSLARIRKEMSEIEELVKQSGFTPTKVEEILKTPAEKLVDQLAKIKHQPTSVQKQKKNKK